MYRTTDTQTSEKNIGMTIDGHLRLAISASIPVEFGLCNIGMVLNLHLI